MFTGFVFLVFLAVIFWISYFVTLASATREDFLCDKCNSIMREWTPPKEKFMAGLKTVLSIGTQLATGLEIGGVHSSDTKMKCFNCNYVRDHRYVPNYEVNAARKRRRIPLFLVSLGLTIFVLTRIKYL